LVLDRGGPRSAAAPRGPCLASGPRCAGRGWTPSRGGIQGRLLISVLTYFGPAFLRSLERLQVVGSAALNRGAALGSPKRPVQGPGPGRGRERAPFSGRVSWTETALEKETILHRHDRGPRGPASTSCWWEPGAGASGTSRCTAGIWVGAGGSRCVRRTTAGERGASLSREVARLRTSRLARGMLGRRGWSRAGARPPARAWPAAGPRGGPRPRESLAGRPRMLAGNPRWPTGADYAPFDGAPSRVWPRAGRGCTYAPPLDASAVEVESEQLRRGGSPATSGRNRRGASLWALVQVCLTTALELLKPWPIKFIIDSVLGGQPTPARPRRGAGRPPRPLPPDRLHRALVLIYRRPRRPQPCSPTTPPSAFGQRMVRRPAQRPLRAPASALHGLP